MLDPSDRWGPPNRPPAWRLDPILGEWKVEESRQSFPGRRLGPRASSNGPPQVCGPLLPARTCLTTPGNETVALSAADALKTPIYVRRRNGGYGQARWRYRTVEMEQGWVAIVREPPLSSDITDQGVVMARDWRCLTGRHDWREVETPDRDKQAECTRCGKTDRKRTVPRHMARRGV